VLTLLAELLSPVCFPLVKKFDSHVVQTLPAIFAMYPIDEYKLLIRRSMALDSFHHAVVIDPDESTLRAYFQNNLRPNIVYLTTIELSQSQIKSLPKSRIFALWASDLFPYGPQIPFV